MTLHLHVYMCVYACVFKLWATIYSNKQIGVSCYDVNTTPLKVLQPIEV